MTVEFDASVSAVTGGSQCSYATSSIFSASASGSSTSGHGPVPVAHAERELATVGVRDELLRDGAWELNR